MFKNLSGNSRLLVVSDTALTRMGNDLLGFEPVVRELDILADLFDEIIWLGYEKSNLTTPFKLPNSKNIRIILMPSSGGKGVRKFKIALNYPIYIFKIFKYLSFATHVHSRAPSHPSLIIQIISFFDRKRIYWHKYAGDWSNPNVPVTYSLQRVVLGVIARKNVFATINGTWNGLSKNILPFENPCLYKEEIELATNSGSLKSFKDKLQLLFVGNLTQKKGILNLIEALDLISNTDLISNLIIVGDGELKEEITLRLKGQLKINVKILGSLNRDELSKIYLSSHINILPSESEGFPKVIAEGAAYGCLPLVTDISSLSQYINHGENGFLLTRNSPDEIAKSIDTILDRIDLKEISLRAMCMAPIFSYEFFRDKLNKKVISTRND